MQIKLPKSIKDLRLYHLEAVAEIDLDKLDMYDRLTLVHKLTGLEMETLKRVSLSDVNKVIEHYLNLIVNHKKKEPPKNIVVNEREYRLIKSVGSQPLGWHIDISNFGTKESNIVAAFCYLESGMGYAEQDKYKNILNPVTPRSEWFKEYLSADIYIDLGFFLQTKSENYKSAYMEIKRQRQKMKRKKGKDTNGKITFT